MNIGVLRLGGETHVNVDIENLQEMNNRTGVNGKVVGFIADNDHPEEHAKGLAVLDSLIDLDTGDGTVCNAYEYTLQRIYDLGVANGQVEVLANLREFGLQIARDIRGKSLPPNAEEEGAANPQSPEFLAMQEFLETCNAEQIKMLLEIPLFAKVVLATAPYSSSLTEYVEEARSQDAQPSSPATTTPIGERGIAQVGDTADGEDGGVLRL